MARIDELFRYLKDSKGSDLHLSSGIAPHVRRHGALEPVPGWNLLSDADLRALLREIASEKQWTEYEQSGDLDFAYGLPNVARFRCNYLVDENGAAAVFRIIPERIVPLAELKAPAAVETVAHLKSGLVLVTGPTGSGKSTTLAAIIDKINDTYNKHIVTIEDPVEFVHKSKRCVFSQREVGTDTESFAAALRAAIRQDADVILVGEMRDLETISLAITAAEMGALVFGTLHTNSAAKTIDRIIDAFPPEQQGQVRTSLSESLKGVIAQLLLRTADGKGRCAVNEILLDAPGLANLIREGNTPMISSVISANKKLGMQTMDDALADKVERKIITPEDAYLKAQDKKRFEKLLPGGAPAGAH